ncbi:sensor histidine kinase [Marinoscillum furvescens]|uniref:histidine kinase n=1 Tax=Marinoscillum furvescens DSM 4134 TaxID=1122208 RepID=A0A3D9KYZ1_MARFU|nr:ATP-binding protein [Marinoscillum furvescens]RED91782.1 phospho-acceptor domain-containing protein [Marinoscillum furvescens DSM 4134]
MKDLLNLDILKRTFDDLPVGVGIFYVPDLEDVRSIEYVFMNKVILYEMRKERDEVFGKKVTEVAPEAFEHEGGLMVLETYRRIAAEGGSINLGLVEYSNHMVAGTYECSVHHIQENYVYVMLRNVTDLEQAKNELELKNKELGQFAYIVSHDLKEPLHTIKSSAQLINDIYTEQLDDQGRQLLSFIGDATGRMTRLITDLLDYSGIGEGKELGMVDCGQLVEAIRQDLSSKIKDTNTTLEIGDLPTINGYETELRMLFQNLISNAIKFSKPDVPPHVKVSAKKDDQWTFFIEDNGIGVPDEHKEKIFRVFQRLHSKSEYEGSGIGLAHCKKVVELHQGALGVDSTPGEGSTFYFSVSDQL